MGRTTGKTLLKAALEAIRAADMSVDVKQSKHVKLRIEGPGGRSTVVLARSPGDSRALMNHMCDVRKAIARCGRAAGP